jgi:hypothetical protein
MSSIPRKKILTLQKAAGTGRFLFLDRAKAQGNGRVLRLRRKNYLQDHLTIGFTGKQEDIPFFSGSLTIFPL